MVGPKQKLWIAMRELASSVTGFPQPPPPLATAIPPSAGTRARTIDATIPTLPTVRTRCITTPSSFIYPARLCTGLKGSPHEKTLEPAMRGPERRANSGTVTDGLRRSFRDVG